MKKCKMADVAQETHDSISCPMCLVPLEDPVTIPCGHNFCMACINDYWNQHECTGNYRCPECRKPFTPRPTLNKNTMFAEVVERLKKARLRDSSPADSEPVHAECCGSAGQNIQAVGLCPGHEHHGGGHNASNLREKHIVIVVSGEPKKNICVHNMPLEIYCRTDQQLICSLCFVENHKDHDAVAVEPISFERRVCERCHEKKWYRERSQGHRRKKHSGHRSGHGKNSPLKKTPEAGRCEHHGHSLRRHGHVEGGGHGQGRPETRQRSSSHGRTLGLKGQTIWRTSRRTSQ